jgi:cytochrome c peroxidase
MKHFRGSSSILFLAAAGVFAFGMASQITAQGRPGYVWDLPKGFPEPVVPSDNPMSRDKVELGRYLFYDKRISVNGKEACASCHRQELAFTDGRKVAVGTTGEFHPRNAMSLVNIAYNGVLTWSDPTIRTLEDQAYGPMYGTHPVELGLKIVDTFPDRIKPDAVYQRLFPLAFPTEPDPFTITNVVKAIACFERSIISARSPYDRYHFGGDDSAVSESAKRGEVLFSSEPLKCFHCHGGFNFSDTTVSKRSPDRKMEFHNTGLYNVTGRFSYPSPNLGIYIHTRDMADVGKFKAPTLRNIAVTGPYMHDGSIATLEGVLEHYEAGGRTLRDGPAAGQGCKNPNKDPQIAGFKLSEQEKEDLIAFLNSLTDEAVLHDPRFSDPWVH